MSWNTTPKKSFFLTDASVGWTLKLAVPDRMESGPDNLRLLYDGFFPDALTSAPSLDAFTLGAAVTGQPGTWRVCSAVPNQVHGPFWRLEVQAKGALSAKAKKIRWVVGSSSFTAENVSFPGSGGPVGRLTSRMPEVGIEVGYLAVGTPPALASGVAATPPAPLPPTPTNPWISIPAEQAMYYYPNGWVREAVDSDEIVPGLYWITERYQYVFDVTG